MGGRRKGHQPGSAGTTIGLLIVITGSALFVSSGFGYQGHIWSLTTALHTFLFGAVITFAGVLLSIIDLSRKKHRKTNYPVSIIALVLGVAVIGVFLRYFIAAKEAPPIYDITTDTHNPPRFEAVQRLRGHSSHPCKYGGPKMAILQKQAYPYIKPLVLDISFESAFSKALAVARNMKHWKIVDSNAAAGRIEATATVPWFGFKDDIVVRISPVNPSCSRIDVRSESRTGTNDFGINARRIKTYLIQIRAK